MRRAIGLLALLAALSGATSASSASLVLDPMTAMFPPNACLTNSMQPVLFTGMYCDGAACPPDPMASWCPGSGFAEQPGLTGIPAGGKRTASLLSALDQVASARIDPGLAQLQVSLPEAHGTEGIWLTYGGSDADWNLDLLGMGIAAIQVPLSGVITPAHPLVLHIVMQDFSNDETPDGSASIDRLVTAPGNVVIPLAEFNVEYRVVFDSADYVSLSFSECGSSSCPGTPGVPARQFAVGPITFVEAGPTPATQVSWGRLKTLYR